MVRRVRSVVAFSNPDSSNSYQGNGSAVTAYPVPFPVVSVDHIKVAIEHPAGADPVPLEASEFTVHSLGNGAYEVTTAYPRPSTDVVTVYREMPLDQPFQFPESNILRTRELERANDRQVQQIQQVDRRVSTHKHDERYIRRTELSNLVLVPNPLDAFSVAANAAGGIGAATSIPVRGGLRFQDGGLLVGGAEAWRNQFIHIYRRTDIDPLTGEISLGTGTINDPYDGSTPARIEAILGPLSAAKTKCNIVWGAGTYTMRPMDPAFPAAHPWFFRDGCHWQGAGKGRTIIQTPEDDMDGRNLMVGWSRLPGDSEVIRCGSIRGITFNGRVTHAPDLPDPSGNMVKYTAAVALEGDEITIEDCEFKNFGGNGQEVFPIGLTSGLLAASDSGAADRNCCITMRDCRVGNIWSGNQSAGLTFGGRSPDTGYSTSPKQRFIIENNHITDCYIAIYNVRGVRIRNNWIDAGRALYGCVNCDTGNNSDIQITGNILIGATYPYGHIGAIVMGHPGAIVDGVPTRIGSFSDITIAGNYLANGPSAKLTAGIVFHGSVENYRIINNTWRGNSLAITEMFIRNEAIPSPWGRADLGYPGLIVNFHPPVVPNGDPTQMWGNVREENGTVPGGVQNTIRASLNITGNGNLITNGAVVTQGGNLGYNRLYVGSRAGIPLLDPYVAASFGIDDVTRTGIEIVNRSSGTVGITLARTGEAPSRWSMDIANGTGNFYIANVEAGPATRPRLEITPEGNVNVVAAGAKLFADVMTPRKGVSYRSGAGWPLAANIEDGVGVEWKNTSTGEHRWCSNDGGTMHYGAIFTTVPGGDPAHYLTPDGGDILTPDGGVILTP